MRYFWALPAALRVALLVAAEQHSFNINDYLLAFPQYEIQVTDDYILQELATVKLRRSRAHTESEERPVDSSASHIERYKPPEPTDSPSNDDYYYEELMLQGSRYLCAIPDVQVEEYQASENNTETKLEQEAELARANARGWELLEKMRGHCVYYNEGWWSYRYCYGSGVRQFHMLAHKGQPSWPPIEDTTTHGYDLGSVQKVESSKSDVAAASPQGDLEIKGGSRYLVQRLQDGDRCDLTLLNRKVEVQFHCNKDTQIDAITQVKELSTCSYLIIVETPRLCNDVAFQPPQKDKPHDITCQTILYPEEVEAYEQELERDRVQVKKIASDQAKQPKAQTPPERWVGDILLGAHHIVPKGVKIERGAIIGGKEKFIVTVASSKGKTLSQAELKEYKLADAKDIEKMKENIAKMAKGEAWRLDVIDTYKGREYRGILGDEDDDAKDAKQDSEQSQGEGEGSEEEFYKEEL